MQEPMNRFPSLASLLIAAFAWTAASPSIADDAEQATPSRKAYTLWQQGYLLHIQGRYAEATETFQDSIDILPTAEAHTYLGWSLSKLGFLQEAIAECKKAIPIDPDYGNPYNDIGVYLVTGAKVRATFHFRDSQGFRILIRSGHGRMFIRY